MSENVNNEETYKSSVLNRGYQELTFINNNAANILEKANKKTTKDSVTIQNRESLTDMVNVIVNDGVFVGSQTKSVGTIIKEAAVKLMSQYESLQAQQIALVDVGMNCILDLTEGSLTNQKHFFSNHEWSLLKKMFLPTSRRSTQTSLHGKFDIKNKQIFKDPEDLEECYWQAKRYQRKSSNDKEKIQYELIGSLIDKLIKHSLIFTLSAPLPSEADIIIKIWADLFEILLHKTGLYISWGEKVFSTSTDDGNETIKFKLDMKVMYLLNNTEYVVCAGEFAPYAGQKKVICDRSKLLVEAKLIYDSIAKKVEDQENVELLKIVNIKIMGLEASLLSLRSVCQDLYAGTSVGGLALPSTGNSLSKEKYTLETVEILKSSIVKKNKNKKSMKRKLGNESQSNNNVIKDQLTNSWRYKKVKATNS